MPKFGYFAAALSVTLILILSHVTLGQRAVTAQEYPGCFMVAPSGSMVNLNALCGQTSSSQPKLEFTNLESQLILGDSIAQVRGTVTNRSRSTVPLSRIYFQLVAANRVVTADNISLLTDGGLKPGQSMSFDKVITKGNLGDVSPSELKVQVTKYQ